MKKQIVAVLMALCMVAGMPETSAAAGTETRQEKVSPEIHTPTQMRIVPDESCMTLAETSGGRKMPLYICNDTNMVTNGGKLRFQVYDQDGRDISEYVQWSSDNVAYASFEDPAVGVATMKAGSRSVNPEVVVTASFEKEGERKFEAAYGFLLLPKVNLSNATVTMALDPDGVVSSVSTKTKLQPTAYLTYNLLDYQDDGRVYAKWGASNWLPILARYPGKHTAVYSEKGNPDNQAVLTVNVSGVAVEDDAGNVGRTTLECGGTTKLTPYTTDESYTMYTGDEADVSWYSEDNTIAAVDEDGVVTGMSAGQTVIHARDKYISAGQTAGAVGGITVCVTEPDKPHLEGVAVSFGGRNIYTDEAAETKAELSQYYDGDVLALSNAVIYGPSSLDRGTYYLTSQKQVVPLTVMPFFDENTVSVELYHNGVYLQTCKRGEKISVEPAAGANDIVLKTVFSDGTGKDGEGSEYHLRFYMNNSDVNGIKSKGITLSAGERELSASVVYNSQPEGTVFKCDAMGNPNTTAYTKQDTEQKGGLLSCVYSDIEMVSVTVDADDAAFGHIAYQSEENAVIVKEGIGTLTTEPAAFGERDQLSFRILTLDDRTYREAAAEGKNPWESENTMSYRYTVCRLKYGLEDFWLQSFSLGETGKVYGFEPSGSTIAGVVDRDADHASLLAGGMKEGVRVYRTSGAGNNGQEGNVLADDGEGNYRTDCAAELKEKVSLYTMYLALQAEDGRYGKYIRHTYRVNLYKRGVLGDAAQMLPADLTGYLCVGSIHTNNSSGAEYSKGIEAERTLRGYAGHTYATWEAYPGVWETASEENLVSLGNFGGFVSYYFEEGIENDQKNPYGVDFIVYGQANTGDKVRNASVYVSENGSEWYELAGSEHYDSPAVWNYQITYLQAEDGSTDYRDNQGRSGNLGANYRYPLRQNYPQYDFSGGMNFRGTLLLGNGGLSDDLAGNAAHAAWGYSGLFRSPSSIPEGISAGQYVGNPYAGTDGYGNGFDLSWAVDTDGLPVRLERVHYVKVMAANFLKSDGADDVSAVAAGIVKTQPALEQGDAGGTLQENVGISVDGVPILLEEGKTVYDVPILSPEFTISVDAPEGADVYINNVTGTSRSYSGDFDFEKGIVRVLVQSGMGEPWICYLKIDSEIPLQKMTAKEELENYKHPDAYREAQKAELSEAIANGKAAIDAAVDGEEVERALAAAKAAIDRIKTDAQLTEEEQAAVETPPRKPIDPVPETPGHSFPVAGSTERVGKIVYKITASSASQKEVTAVKPNKKSYVKLTIPATVKIGGYSYKVTGIGAKAFRKNKKLAQLTIGANVKKIGSQAFWGCTRLGKVAIRSAKLKKVGRNAFSKIKGNAKIYVPKNKLAAYQKMLRKTRLAKSVTIKKKSF